MGIPDHLTSLLKNLYAGQETMIRIRHGTTDWFQIGKGVRQGCILSPSLFYLYAEYIMRNVRLDEEQAGIKISGRNIITSDMQMTPPLWQNTKRNWRASWWKWKSEKAGLKLSIQKTKIIASSPIQFSCSVMSNSATPLTTACQASLSITNFQSLPKLMSIESVMPSNYLILYWPLLLLPSIFPSIRIFSNESVLPIRWPKYWSFSFSISSSVLNFLYCPTLTSIHDYWKNHSFD